jgi:plasmid stabilization system protein ParE
VRYSALAKDDIHEIYRYVFARSESGAEKLLNAIVRTIRSLADTPGIGHRHPTNEPELDGLRITTVTPYRSYLIGFRVRGDAVEVVRVTQASRDLNQLFDHLDLGFDDD